MIILPDKNIPRSKFLVPLFRKEWMTPSLSQPKDCFGNENKTSFAIIAKTNDGKICWRGIYDDRDDFDAVLFAIAEDTLKYQKQLWSLSTPNWDPWLSELITYNFISYTKLTTPTGSNQTYTKLRDWSDNINKIECIGAGGSGGAGSNSGNATGGGGGAYSEILNFSFGAATTATYQIGTGGTAVTNTLGKTASAVNGNIGGSSWFNNATDPGVGTDNTKCSAQGGRAGAAATTSGVLSGGAGGAVASGWGQTKFAGGAGGSTSGSANRQATGGGGAGGSTSAGNAGGNSSSTSGAGSNGGAGGAGDGIGSAGTAGTGTTASPAGAGGNGTNLSDGTVGTGGGGGGLSDGTNTLITGASGGNYGAGSGGTYNNGAGSGSGTQTTSVAGVGGLILITYAPRRVSVST